jgi:hypothetical protein
MASKQKFLITALLFILLGILLNFFYSKFTGKVKNIPYVEQGQGEFAEAQAAINNYANSNDPSRKKFTTAYTIDMDFVNSELAKLDNPNKTVFGLRIVNGLDADLKSDGSNKKVIIKFLDKNGDNIAVRQHIVCDYRDLCPPKCDVTGAFGTFSNADKPSLVTVNSASKYQSSYYDSSSVVYGSNILFDKIRSITLEDDILDYLKNYKTARLYFALDANNKREVYIFGANINSTGQAVIVTNKFYQVDYRDLCPPKCD